MKPLLLTACLDGPDGPYAGMYADNAEVWAKYADVIGYEVRALTTPVDCDFVYTVPDPYWFKITLIRAALKAGHPYVFWLDVDTIIVNATKDMRDALPGGMWLGMCNYPVRDNVDIWHPQTGVMYIRNCAESLEFFSKIASMQDDAIPGIGNELCAIHYLMYAEPHYQSGIVTLPHEWNYVTHFFADWPTVPIVAHFAGNGTPAERRELMKWYKTGTPVPAHHGGTLTPLDDFTLACQAKDRRDWPTAAKHFQRVIDVDPDQLEARAALAQILGAELCRYQDGIDVLKYAIAKEPRDGQRLALMGELYAWLGDVEQSGYYYDLALTYAPTLPITRWNKSLWLLQHGEYHHGWAWYEYGKIARQRPLRSDQPEWDGKAAPTPNGTLYVWCEQGLGDAIQFCRFLPMVKERWGGRVILEVQETLIPLMHNAAGADMVVRQFPDASFALPFDEHVALLSLPFVFGINNESQFWNGTYLKAEPTKLDGDFKVGFCWKGNQAHVNNRMRSSTREEFQPMIDVPGVTAYSLVPGEPIEGHELNLSDWAKTAAAIAGLDLVVSVDTSVVHLAGALGVKTYLLNPFVSDWRWGRSRDTSPWYPRLTIWRQEVRGDWADVIAQITERLTGWTETPDDAPSFTFDLRADEPTGMECIERLDNLTNGHRPVQEVAHV